MKADRIIGRQAEQKKLEMCYKSGKAELVAVYGRRRIGKTFLVKQYFKDSFDFYATGIYEGSLKEQLRHWNRQLQRYSGEKIPQAENWFDAFDQLQDYLERVRKHRMVVFIDELPWMDTHKSRFTKAFELFWNSWGADQDNLMVVVCGSATTWMTDKLLGNKGGLHNRVTRQIRLAPFSLGETSEFLHAKGMLYTPCQVAECYMIMGGTPYYLNLLQKGYSLSQNVDVLFFAQNAELKAEYQFLFRSLFRDSAVYKRVVELLGSKAKGMTRNEITKGLGLTEGGSLTTVLDNLVNCDFITRYTAFGKKERGTIYQLTDLYTLFYLRFVAGHNGYDEHRWSNMIDNPSRRVWSGYAFEQLCLHHIPQIKNALGISGIQTAVCSWSCRNEGHGAQIDLLIDRRDGVISLCEMKFSNLPYEIKRDYAEWMEERRERFREETGTSKALHLVLITPAGVKENMYAATVQNVLSLKDLM